MKVLVCGDRNWSNFDSVLTRLSLLPKNAIIIHGCARGADSMAGEAAKKLELPVREFPANWDLYGKAAGPIRNLQMLDKKPDLVIAFHQDLSKSRGTAHTVREATKRNIPVEVIVK